MLSQTANGTLKITLMVLQVGRLLVLLLAYSHWDKVARDVLQHLISSALPHQSPSCQPPVDLLRDYLRGLKCILPHRHLKAQHP